jgi:hypothetical protein
MSSSGLTRTPELVKGSTSFPLPFPLVHWTAASASEGTPAPDALLPAEGIDLVRGGDVAGATVGDVVVVADGPNCQEGIEGLGAGVLDPGGG